MKLASIFQYWKRDALAGTVTGVMAIPLTIGICLMSDYPIMMGLYTAIFAGFVSFTTYLFKPGNYTGTPGVAAGLAPVLALGISSFGYENMPFLILLTAVIQAVIWRFRVEKYILRLVPHYLVEGLLAGVGLKIALKFVPFLYDTEHETSHWLDYERELVIILSILSFTLFVLLFKFYKKKMPALPYFIIMATSIGMAFVLPLPRISIEAIPFKLVLPFPHFEGAGGGETIWIITKMIGFALMLATIDVIEQVMSNVAIEKMDPFKRKTDSNNSLLSIWLANLGGAFFGGMTNLDGLAKSTTNTVAGAVTKLSNLFTAVFILVIVLNPSVISLLPEYALGIIMVYSGWKMIANISHVRSEGRYALILSAVCGLMVFEMGIFEGLLLVLLTHAIIQFIFMKRMGKTSSEIFSQFVTSLKNEENLNLEHIDTMTEPDVPIFRKWLSSVNEKDLKGMHSLYAKHAIETPLFSSQALTSLNEIDDYYEQLFQLDNLAIVQEKVVLNKDKNSRINSGVYRISWEDGGIEASHLVKFSIVVNEDKIICHHSNLFSDQAFSIKEWLDERKNSTYLD